MKKTIAIAILLMIGSICFGQKAAKDSTVKKDSINNDTKFLSMNDLISYLNRINTVTMKQFDLTQAAKHQEIIKVVQAVIAEADRKRREK